MTRQELRPTHRLFDLLASLKVGVVTMVVLAVACAVATFYESAHGTAAAQRVFYRTGWFTFVIALLGVNVLLSMLKRYPWRRHQAGFVLTHTGIVLLLVGGLASLHTGLDGTMALLEGEQADRVTLGEMAVTVAVSHGQPTVVAKDFDSDPPRPDRPRWIRLAGATLVLDDYAVHVDVHEGVEEAESGPPALHYVLAGGFGQQHGWLVADGERARADFGPLLLTLRSAATEKDARALPHATGNEIAFVQGSDGQLRYALVNAKSGTTDGTVEVGKPVVTPWMGMTITVERALVHAAPGRTVAPAPPPAKEARRRPAVKVRVDGGAPQWVPFGETAHVGRGRDHVDVGFGNAQEPLPFSVSLLRFRSDKYPDSNMPATYESQVRIDDPERGVSEHVIAMNRPLHHAGYTLFQASYIEGDPMGSVLSVSRSPGLPLVYAGTALITLGVAWMVYLRPFLLRREASRANAERDRRPSVSTQPRGPLAGAMARAGGAR